LFEVQDRLNKHPTARKADILKTIGKGKNADKAAVRFYQKIATMGEDPPIAAVYTLY